MSQADLCAGGEHTSNPPGVRLLLAEDDLELRNLLALVLREDGHDVVEARNGSELWKLLSNESGQPFALVVSDLRMPGLTAFEVLSKLHDAHRETPVILITAFGDPHTHQRALRLGATRVFDKPFDFDELRRAVREALREHPRRAFECRQDQAHDQQR